MKKILFIFLFMSVSDSFAEGCNADEIMVASCDLPGKAQRMAVFCAKKHNDNVRYLFEENNLPELSVEFNSRNRMKRWVDLGTYSTYLGFNKGKYSYVLIIPEERPDAVALLEIKLNGEKISTKRCNSNSFGEHHIKKDSIEDVPDEIVRENGFKFP